MEFLLVLGKLSNDRLKPSLPLKIVLILILTSNKQKIITNLQSLHTFLKIAFNGIFS